MKEQYVQCKQCDTIDFPRWINSDEYTVGTSIKMFCKDCGCPKVLLCRKCCPTGHGTHEEILNLPPITVQFSRF